MPGSNILEENCPMNDENSVHRKRRRGLVGNSAKSVPNQVMSSAKDSYPVSAIREQNILRPNAENRESTLPAANSGLSSASTEAKDNKSSKNNKRPLSEKGNNLENLPRDTSTIKFALSNDFTPIVREDSNDVSDDEDEEPPVIMITTKDVSNKKKPGQAYAEADYDVDRILLCQLRKNISHYLIKWDGYGFDELTWQKKFDLSCDKKLKQFEDRVSICKKIFNSLSDRDQYRGFYDYYAKGIITPTFPEQNLFEASMLKFMQDNQFASMIVENWTRVSNVLPTITWIGESIFSYPAKCSIEKADAEVPVVKCKCPTSCRPASCLCLKAKITAKGLIRSEFANFINECHKDCKCDKKCPSKIFRRGRTFQIMLFKTQKCGWSVRTLVPIPARRFVMEYVGLVKLFEECHEITDQTYLFNCDLPDGSIKYVIDATDFGNESRFVNHSCDGNMDAFSVIGYHSDPHLTRIVFFSNRDIKAGEELSFNYFRGEADSAEIDPSERSRNLRVCRCGAENCRKYLF